ncbi:transposase [Halobacterium salinarum]|uniref:transposase n=1 Tax=Halobacterium salinarum TaxID=2242 RepID=UPI002554266A|nr:transposase [Halobacterium salinarum]MDL0138617.1 transposase [Halobacterium salinarum]
MTETPAAAQALVTHAEQLCEHVDHLWDLLTHLSIPTDHLVDTRQQHKVTFDTGAMTRAFLYQHARGFSQKELAGRMDARPVLVHRFGLDSTPTQQTLSDVWTAFGDVTCEIIEAAAIGIRRTAVEHGVIAEALVPTAPSGDDTDAEAHESEKEYTRRKATKTFKLARKHGFPEFESGRTLNRQFDDEQILDMVARVCAHEGSAHEEGEHAWITDDDQTAHGSTILRVLKLFATPDGEAAQLTIDELRDDDRMPDIDRIRDTLMTAYDNSVENVINTIRGDDPFDDRKVTAAIDITHERFHVFPWQDKAAGIPKADYPRMVSGYKKNGEYKRGYKYATITLVGDLAPIPLAIEPVKENSNWEADDAPSYSKAALVERLLDKALQFVDIDEVMFDRGFYSNDVYAAVANRGLTYLSPVPKYEDEYESIADIESHPEADAAVKHDVPFGHDGEVHHTAEFLYVPSTNDDADGKYAVFVTNRDRVEFDEIEAVCNRYSRRWDIENQYKSIKKFLPRTSSTDYRVRLCNFVLATLFYVLWRLTDYLIKRGKDVRIRSPPEITAKTFVRALGEFLRTVD